MVIHIYLLIVCYICSFVFNTPAAATVVMFWRAGMAKVVIVEGRVGGRW